MLMLLLRRVVGLVVTLVAAAAVVFLVLEVLPGDPASVMLGTSAQPDTLAALRRQMGLDRPMAERFFTWIAGLAQGDLGESYTYGVPVASLIAERLVVTVPLAVFAIVLATAIALPLGIYAAAMTIALGFIYSSYSALLCGTFDLAQQRQTGTWLLRLSPLVVLLVVATGVAALRTSARDREATSPIPEP